MQPDGKNSVAVVRYDETSNALRRAIDLCDGFEGLRSSDKILLKPNIIWGGGIGRKMPKYGIVTTSRIVEDLVKLLREWGCENISVGEATLVNKELGSETLGGYKWTGIARVAKGYGVKLIDFNQEPFERIEMDGTSIAIARAALDADFLINLSVLKTHHQARVSLGLKNLKGCLEMRSKMEFHRRGLDHMIALLNTQIKPKLTIIDGIYAMENGPSALGTAHRMNLIIAGQDNLSCDIVGSAVLGIEPSSVEHLSEFASIANRSLDLAEIDVKGENIEDVTKKLEWKANNYQDIYDRARVGGITVQDPGKRFCTGCVSNLQALSVVFCKDNPGITLKNTEICCGPEVKPKADSKNVFLFGDCSIRANKDLADGIRLKGCPPGVIDSLVTFMNHSIGKHKGRKIMGVRLLKMIANRLRIYDEDMPTYRRYESPEFDERHF
jgi:uncharacterized protein (DUF362 family)